MVEQHFLPDARRNSGFCPISRELNGDLFHDLCMSVGPMDESTIHFDLIIDRIVGNLSGYLDCVPNCAHLIAHLVGMIYVQDEQLLPCELVPHVRHTAGEAQ